ncbi:MAG: hypothetical protein K9N55_05685 [Phycisphaerae bacterium]|nr:hypothetical protein [Phycisphaerae bacterium]
MFLIAVAAHVFVRVRMKSERGDFDEVYYEFEETDPAYRAYMTWYKWTLWVASASLLLLFIGVAI